MDYNICRWMAMPDEKGGIYYGNYGKHLCKI